MASSRNKRILSDFDSDLTGKSKKSKTVDDVSFPSSSQEILENGNALKQEPSDELEETSDSVILRFREAMQIGNLQQVGSIVRKTLETNKSIMEILEKLAESLGKPEIPLKTVASSVKNADLEGMKDLFMGKIFIDSLPNTPRTISKGLDSSPIVPSQGQPQKLEKLFQLPLLGVHIIPACPPFPTVNLNIFYEKHTLVGDCASAQLSDIMRKIFSTILTPTHEIWLYSYRYNTTRQTDRHFRALPKEVAEVLIEFGMDVFGGYLPEHLLYGSEVDPNDEFVRRLLIADPQADIERRRCARSPMKQIVQHAISESLRQLRTYHFVVSSGSLVSCQQRKMCSTHIQWEMVRRAREQLRSVGKDEDQWLAEDLGIL